jgi:hypothetical protein
MRGQQPSRLEYFPDDFDESLTYMELPYYRHEFERKKRVLRLIMIRLILIMIRAAPTAKKHSVGIPK